MPTTSRRNVTLSDITTPTVGIHPLRFRSARAAAAARRERTGEAALTVEQVLDLGRTLIRQAGDPQLPGGRHIEIEVRDTPEASAAYRIGLLEKGIVQADATICVPRQWLEAPVDVLAAIIAHEIGHVALHGHTDRDLHGILRRERVTDLVGPVSALAPLTAFVLPLAAAGALCGAVAVLGNI